MRRYLCYARYVLRHQQCVRRAGFRNGLLWRGVKHDWSKWLPSEFIPYARRFYLPDGSKRPQTRDATGAYDPTNTGDPDFDRAWFHHQRRNDHHWQWWLNPQQREGTRPTEMSKGAVVEMLCDWSGAGRAQGGDGNFSAWWHANNHDMQLHPRTRELVLALMPRVLATLGMALVVDPSAT